MADIKSAAGEGPEPQVPGRDQPAQELANLIAQSEAGAKGKGFWRRRRRKNTTPEPTPAPEQKQPAEPATDVPNEAAQAPTGGESAGATGTASGEPAETAESATGKSAEAAEDKSSASEAGESASSGSKGSTEPAAGGSDGAAESAAGGSEAAAAPASGADVKADGSGADESAKSGDAAIEDGAEVSAGDSSAEVSAPETREGEPKDGSSAEAAESADGGSGGGVRADAEDGAAEVVGEDAAESVDKAENAGEGVAAKGERPRPTVGVVYEPDESPDGFPLEYGNIIVGLPKQADGSSVEVDEERAYAEELAAVQSAGMESAQDEVEEPAEQAAADEAGEEAEQAAADEPGEDVAQAGQAATDQPGEETTQAVEAAEATEAASEQSAAEAEPTSDHSSDEVETAEAPEGAVVEDSSESAESAAGDESADDVAEPVAEEPADEKSAEDGARATADGGQASDGEQTSSDAEVASGAEPAAAVAEEAAEGGSGGGAAETAAGEAAEDVAGTEADAEQGSAAEDAVEGAQESADAGSAEEPEGESDRESADAGSAEEGGDESDRESADAGSAEEGGDESDRESAEVASAEGAAEGDSGGEVAESAAGEAAEDVVAEEADGEQASDDAEVASAEADSAEESDQESADEPAEEPSEDAEAVEVELTAEELAERLAAEQAAMALITSLMKLRGALAGSRLPLDVVGADEARQQQKAMLDQLDDYILPRLVQLEAPILAVVGGSTGAGKSTLVNSVIGKVVSEPGVLRPTTRSPVLIHHPADADWFIGDRVLPGMARTTAESPGGMEDPGQLRLVASDTVPRGLAVLDAPDIDSVVEANRDLATQLLAAADLWLFVTTAARYSDAVPWEFLQSASDRSTAVAVVLDRAPAETIDDITGHLAQMLLERGLGDSPLFSIRETVVDGNGMLPGETVASIKDWLVDLAADAEARAAVVRRTLHGAVTSMVKTTPPFAAAVRAQGDTAVELRSSVEAAYDQAVKDIATSTQDASLLRGEVLARWQEFVGTGELLKGLQGNSGKLREKVKKSIAATPAPTRDLNDAIESGLSSLLVEQAEAAAERAEKIWQATPAGRQLLAVARSAAEPDTETGADTSTDSEIALGAMSPEFQANAERAVREWQAGVLDLVRQVGTEKRLAARILDAGVNGLSLSVMVVLFAENAGIPTGAEASIGVGSAVVGQKLLTAVFGDAAVQTLMSKARADLDGKVHALMDAEFARYLAVLDQHPVDPEAARQLTEAARAVEDCT
ncbi:hypothetical protein GCM10009745_60040 [Kribbella yunnanensis]|uniref:AAA family ATPase n=1 Tax=Kribbella yunnanensis TaxID=190194 RepID=A0ABN2IG64_9ACTN